MKIFIITVLIFSTFIVLIFRSCRYDWNPHYLDNSAVTIQKKIYSPDSTVVVLFYTLDVGGRGFREYKTLLREADYKSDISTQILPPEIVVLRWIDSEHIEAHIDPNEKYRFGGPYTDLDLNKDTINVNGIDIIITKRIPIEKH